VVPGWSLERNWHLLLHKQGRGIGRKEPGRVALQTPTHNVTLTRRLTRYFSQLGFAALICCAILGAGFVYVLGYTPGALTGPRPTSAVTHVPTDETIGHR